MKNQAQHPIHAGAILMSQSSLLPKELQVESEQAVPGWKLLTNMDRYALDRKIRAAGWTFFSMAGQIQAIALGFDRRAASRRAIAKMLAKPKSEKMNALDIARIESKSFLGIPYTTVYASSRHIQKSIFLSSAEDVEHWDQAKLARERNRKRWGIAPALAPLKEQIARAVPVPATVAPTVVNF
jgi:hypothetical protein